MDEGGAPVKKEREVPEQRATSSDMGDEQTGSKTEHVSAESLQDQTASTRAVAGTEASTSQPKKKELLPVSDETIAKLGTAFIQSLQPHFEHSKASLDELVRNQELLMETVEQENRKYKENQMLEEVNERMRKARLYQTKLVNIRKEMVNLHDRVGKLKKRALKLQSQRMKANLQREQQKEREYEEDRLLRARPASSQPTDGPSDPPP